jgi:phage baseplate assembly protein W
MATGTSTELIDFEEYKILKNSDYVYRDFKPVYNDEKLIGITNDFDIEAVKNSLINIFLISKTEVPGHPEFGNSLNMSLFEIIDSYTMKTIESAVLSALSIFDPRIHLESLDFQTFEDLNRIVVEIKYSIIINDNKIFETIYLPFSSNDKTYLSGRQTINP